MKNAFLILLLSYLVFCNQHVNADPVKRYYDKMDLAKDIIDAVLKNNAFRLEAITQSLVIPFTEYKSIVFPLYIEDSLATFESFPKNEVYPVSLLLKDSLNYNHFIADFYFGEYIGKLLNDPDNLNPFGKNIYIAFDKEEDSISTQVNKNYLGILYETDGYVKVINLEALITYKHTLYSMRQTNYHSYKKDDLPAYLFKRKLPDNIAVYKYENKKFIKYTNDTLLFDDVDYSNYTNETQVSNIEENDIIPVTIDTIAYESPKESEVYDRASEMPEFPGGTAEMLKYVSRSIMYPKAAKEKGLEGKVIIKFYVDTDGTVKDPVVLKDGVGGGCAEEALRIVRSMPKWKPGYDNSGSKVKVYYIIPITFKLQ
ncbi:MAG TPA: energy transducer TonB [Chitinophagales bacterium]|nr:energy transducer TonB [Chitinophagales bacterium]HNL85166.1 energy transducer TonB [Chitinophagales bacterium]